MIAGHRRKMASELAEKRRYCALSVTSQMMKPL